jgi:hypothetical protein
VVREEKSFQSRSSLARRFCPGCWARRSPFQGAANTAVGYQAVNVNTTGSSNTAVVSRPCRAESILSLAEELKQGTIESVLRKSDLELSLEFLLGKRKL